MTEHRYSVVYPDGHVGIILPAYFDRSRELCHPEATLKRGPQGWVMTYPETSDDGVITQVILSEDKGELLSTDSDVTFPDGQTVYAETQAEYEEWAVAKTLFCSYQVRNPDLIHPNTHFHEYTGPAIPLTSHEWTCDQIPTNRDFRDAWEETAVGVSVNMSKAYILHMDDIRGDRNKELEKLDVPFIRAVEAADTTEQARIISLKQALRDIPQTFDLTTAATPENLKALWPVELPTRTDG